LEEKENYNFIVAEISRRHPIEAFSADKIKSFLQSRSVVSHNVLNVGKIPAMKSF